MRKEKIKRQFKNFRIDKDLYGKLLCRFLSALVSYRLSALEDTLPVLRRISRTGFR